MAISEQTTALVSVFPNRARAERFVAALRQAGFRDNEIGMASPDGAEDKGTLAEEGALAGALTGVAPGAVAGAVATGLVPGVGPIISVGLLAGVLGGAAAGATTGGLLGALMGLGISEDEARQSEEAVRAGRTVVAVSATGRLGEAAAILRRQEKDRGE
jgi:hypothetical protein